MYQRNFTCGTIVITLSVMAMMLSVIVQTSGECAEVCRPISPIIQDENIVEKGEGPLSTVNAALTSYDYYIQADSDNDNSVKIDFVFSSDPWFADFSVLGCGSIDPASDEAPFLPPYEVQTYYYPCEHECSNVSIKADPLYGTNQYKTVHLDDRYHIGCNFEKYLAVST